MATYSGNSSLAANLSISQVLGSYTVSASSYFVGQVALGVGVASVGYAQITVGGNVAATLAISAATPNGSDVRQATIHAGPNQNITVSSNTTGASVFITGIELLNTGP